MMLKVGTANQSVREKWLARAIGAVPAGWRILDAGAGELKYKPLCAHLNYVSQDFGQYDGQGDAKGLQMGAWDQTRLDIVCDITAIPEPDGSFDAIMCVEVFEHLPNPLLALREFQRLLRPGGQLIITAPFCSLTHFAPYHFYSGFNRYFYETHLQALGLEIVDMQHNGNFFEYVAQEVRRIGEVARMYAGRKLNLIEKLLVKLLLLVLARYSAKDQGSGELVAFGYHVKAVKRGGAA